MKLVYNLKNTKTGLTTLYYYGFSNVRLSYLINKYGRKGSYVIFSPATIVDNLKIVIFCNDTCLEVYEGTIPINITIEYINVTELGTIIDEINTEKRRISKQFPFPNYGAKRYGDKYKEVNPDKQRTEKYAMRNYKGKLKV